MEIEPTRSRAKLERLAPPIRAADWVDVPDSPLGVPRADSVTVACVVRCTYGAEAVAHLRVIDRNAVALRAAVGAAVLAGLRGVVFLRGDRPPGATYVEDLTPEQAAAEARRSYPGLSVGLLLSIRHGPARARERLGKADFYLVTNARGRLGDFEEVAREASRLGARLYPYVVVATPRNAHLVGGLRDAWRLEEVPRAVEAYWGLAAGLLISAPGDFDALAEAVRAARRAAGRG